MKTTELRIGNLVYFRNESYKVVLIANDLIKIDIGFGAVQRFKENPIYSPKLDELNPIPLTEEWLLKLGFKKMTCIDFNHEKEWVINPDKYGWELGVLLEDYPDDNPNCGCVSILQSKNIKIKGIPPDLIDKEKWTKEDEKRADKYRETLDKWRQPIAYHIRYIHQLQNLYFALTGEELIIK